MQQQPWPWPQDTGPTDSKPPNFLIGSIICTVTSVLVGGCPCLVCAISALIFSFMVSNLKLFASGVTTLVFRVKIIPPEEIGN